jgi:decaprenylphospho-beta-D-erythro-pentofuranosid-2-ulose 2-reductase
MSSQTVLILGAASDVGQALAKQFYSSGYELLLAARKTADIDSYLNKWPSKEKTTNISFDACDFANHKNWMSKLPVVPDIAICVFGYLGDQTKAMEEWGESSRIIDTNYSGAVSILNIIAGVYARQGSGIVVGISSVAGDRGRQSNFIYGSAKAGFTTYLSGLRNSMLSHGVHVLTVKPGFIDTKMTAGLKLPKALTATPDQVAKKIFKGIRNRKNVIYVLPIWFLIMMVIRHIPEFIFKRLKL